MRSKLTVMRPKRVTRAPAGHSPICTPTATAWLENDLEAFKIYNEIAEKGVEPGSEDTGYFVNALISLAGYYRRGIPDSPVKSDLSQARQLYFQAASTFGVPEAQFQLAKMLLSGDGGSVNVQQAKKWLNRARKNGHAGAMGVFGNVILPGRPDGTWAGLHDRRT